MAALTQPIKWHGGKSYLASRIVALMPPRCKNPNKPDPADPGWLHYVEPFAGGLAVLLANDPEGISEAVNDLNAELCEFWRVMGNVEWFSRFHRVLMTVPFSQREWHDAAYPEGDTVDRAAAFFIRCRQSLAGRMDSFAPLTRNRTRRGMNEQASAWLNAVEGLPAVHERLKRVAVLGPRPAVQVIRQQDGPRTLFYLDPPYLHETRATTGEYGTQEMSEADHRELLETLETIEGRFLLSGYRSALYDETAKLQGWNRHDFDLPNNAAGGDSKRRMTESVWVNY